MTAQQPNPTPQPGQQPANQPGPQPANQPGPQPANLPDTNSVLWAVAATAALLVHLVVLWWLLPSLAAPSAPLALLMLIMILAATAVVAFALDRKYVDATDVEAAAPAIFVICFSVSILCILLASSTGSREDVPGFLRTLADLLAHNAVRQLLLAIIYATLVGSILAWGVLFAASGWLIGPGLTAQYPPTTVFRDEITSLIKPIQALGLPTTSILSLQRKRGGSYEYTIRMDDPLKQQDSRGEWITVKREKTYVAEVDKQGKVLSLTEPEKKSP